MNDFLEYLFDVAVIVLRFLGAGTQEGYEIANIVIFVFLQPALIILFFCCGEMKKIKREFNGNYKYIF